MTKRESFELRDELEVEDLSDEEKSALERVARDVVEEGKTLQEALGVADDYVETMEFYAHRLYANGEFEKMAVLVEGLIALDETRYYPYLLLGDVAMQEEPWEEAVQCLGAASNFGPEASMLEGKLGEALLRAGRLEEAVIHLQQAVELGDEPDDKYRRRSETLLDLVDRQVETATDSEGPATKSG
jgi:tetratricopeptide (TPR) repeat protein